MPDIYVSYAKLPGKAGPQMGHCKNGDPGREAEIGRGPRKKSGAPQIRAGPLESCLAPLPVWSPVSPQSKHYHHHHHHHHQRPEAGAT